MYFYRRFAGRVCACGVSIAMAVAAPLAQVPRDRPTPPPAAPAGTCSLAGRMVIATASGVAPVRRARVVLESSALKQPMTTETDSEGRYRFSALPAGPYRAHGEKAGFVAKLADPRRVFEAPTPIDLRAGQSATADFVMQAGAALEGRLIKENGDPAANIVVSAVRLAYDVTGRKPVAVQQARTDDLGRFRVHTLPPGDYYVDAAPDPLDAARMPPQGPRPSVLSRTYYPGSARFDDARIVSVTVGQTLSNLDFSVSSASVARLGARLATAAGQPANDGGFRVQRVGGPTGEVRGSASPGGNQVSYAAVPAGDYWLMGVWRSAPGADAEFGITRITVAGEDQLNLSVVTAKAPSLTGRVEGVAIPPGLQVVAYETAYEWPAIVGDQPWKWTAPVAADGTFTFSALPGPRLLRLTGVANAPTISRIVAGDVDVTDVPTEIKPGESMAVRIVAAPNTATLSGSVKDSTGVGIEKARVVVFSDDERTWGPRSRMVKAVESNATGQYEVRGLLPGTYWVIALDYLDENAWNDATVLAKLKTGAISLTTAGGAATLPLVVKR